MITQRRIMENIMNENTDNNKDDAEARIDALNIEVANLKHEITSLEAINERDKMGFDRKLMERCTLMLEATPYLQDMAAYGLHTDREIRERALNSVREDEVDFSDKTNSDVKKLFSDLLQEHRDKGISFVDPRVAVRNHDNLSMHDQMAKSLNDDWYEAQASKPKSWKG
jgi:hypothetical protein